MSITLHLKSSFGYFIEVEACTASVVQGESVIEQSYDITVPWNAFLVLSSTKVIPKAKETYHPLADEGLSPLN